MKLFYYQRKDGISNFGDALNDWLWPQLLGDRLKSDSSTVLVGIGTLLNSTLPTRVGNAQKVIIFSTGAGYEQPLKHLNPNWHIICLRGPLSAKRLGLSTDLAITDGALLVRRLFVPQAAPKTDFAFMPHVHHAQFAGDFWAAVCQEIGWRYIDPRWSVEQVLTAISQTKVLLAEAMHGAIVADALRVPWIPVVTSPRILVFKWHDWCASVGVAYRPRYLMPLPDYPPYSRGIRSGLKGLAHWGHCLSFAQFQAVGGKLERQDLALVAQALQNIAIKNVPTLSKDKTIETLATALDHRVSQLLTQ
jgi:succinoglycan biosynthesis protein ExoV